MHNRYPGQAYGSSNPHLPPNVPQPFSNTHNPQPYPPTQNVGPYRGTPTYNSQPYNTRYPTRHPGQIGYGTNNPPSPAPTNTPLTLPANRQTQWYSSFYNQIPPHELQNLQAWFNTVDTDRSGTIEAEELQHVTFDRRAIGAEVAKRLVQVFDKDRNGCIDFYEYATMHKFISHMRQAFLAADGDRSGRIDAYEIHQALANAGFSYLTMGSIVELLNKFDRTRMGLDWCEFLLMSAHIALCRSVFQWNDKEGKGYIVLNEDQFTQISAFLLPS